MRRSAPFVAILGLFLGLAACRGPEYPNCDTDEQCADKGEVCVEGTCQQCRDDTNCAEGEQCKGGRCEVKPECVRDGDCADDKVCRSGKCQFECETNEDCGTGLECQDNRCVDPLACSDDGECTGGFKCYLGRCTDPASIPTERCDYPPIQFEFNRANLTTSARDGLQTVVDCLKSKGGTIIVEGHADERGTEEYNLALGERRARSVRDYLTRLGVDSSKLQITSKGEAEPIAYGSNEEAWAQNRRVEFIER